MLTVEHGVCSRVHVMGSRWCGNADVSKPAHCIQLTMASLHTRLVSPTLTHFTSSPLLLNLMTTSNLYKTKKEHPP